MTTYIPRELGNGNREVDQEDELHLSLCVSATTEQQKEISQNSNDPQIGKQTITRIIADRKLLEKDLLEVSERDIQSLENKYENNRRTNKFQHTCELQQKI